MAGEAAGADQLDLEAAEQLIQLSGGDGGGGSESRSWDSVTCRSADQAGGVKEKEVTVESRRRGRRSVGRKRFVAGKDGNGGGEAGEPDGRRKSADDSVDNKRSSSRAASTEEDEPAVESRRRDAGVVDGDGEDRRRPCRFRWLADIYRETTRQLIMTRDLRVVVGDDLPEAAQRRRKRKRAADTGDVIRGGGRPRAVQGKQEEMSNGGIGIIDQ